MLYNVCSSLCLLPGFYSSSCVFSSLVLFIPSSCVLSSLVLFIPSSCVLSSLVELLFILPRVLCVLSSLVLFIPSRVPVAWCIFLPVYDAVS